MFFRNKVVLLVLLCLVFLSVRLFISYELLREIKNNWLTD